MGLVIDKRAEVEGAGVHALLVGVSEYANLPDHDDPPTKESWFLNKLTSPALSAFKIFDFIQQSGNLRLPVKTVRVLLSPSPTELVLEPRLGATDFTRANRANFERLARDWREDANVLPDDMTMFYFSGHGMQRGPEDGVLLLEDFLSPGPPLAKCFEIGDLRNGMAPTPTYSKIAMTQFYFIDACLVREEAQRQFLNPQVPDVFGVELSGVDRRQAPIIFSTVDGAIALGQKGKPSHFAEALELALVRGADEAVDIDGTGNMVWPITPVTIKTALDTYYKKHSLGEVKVGGVVGSPVIRYLSAPPEVDISVRLKPDDLGKPCGIWLSDEGGAPACPPRTETQFEMTVRAGIYRVVVDSTLLKQSPYRSSLKYLTQKVSWPWLHNLSRYMKPPPGGGPTA